MKVEIALLASGMVIAAVNLFVESWWLVALIPVCGALALAHQQIRFRRERARARHTQSEENPR